MKPRTTLRDTILLMRELHGGDLDKGGFPYWTHPLRVMLRLGRDAHPVERHAALLHDTIEDTGITSTFLARRGYSDKVIGTVEILTRIPNGPFPTYKEYITQIAKAGVWATRVKLADLYDNSAPGRISLCDPNLANMVEKRFLPAIATLQAALRPGFPAPFFGDPRPGSVCEAFYPTVYRASLDPVAALIDELWRRMDQIIGQPS